MQFKDGAAELEYPFLHPLVKGILSATDEWCKANKYPELVITDVLHTDDEMETIYWQEMMRTHNGVTEATARKMARNKDSWHRYMCAVDVRSKQYPENVRSLVSAHMRLEMQMVSKKPGFWEFIDSPHGNGPHYHIARKDVLFRDEYVKIHRPPFNISPQITKHNDEEPQI